MVGTCVEMSLIQIRFNGCELRLLNWVSQVTLVSQITPFYVHYTYSTYCTYIQYAVQYVLYIPLLCAVFANEVSYLSLPVDHAQFTNYHTLDRSVSWGLECVVTRFGFHCASEFHPFVDKLVNGKCTGYLAEMKAQILSAVLSRGSPLDLTHACYGNVYTYMPLCVDLW